MVDLKYEECIARIRSDKESNPKIIDLRIHAMQMLYNLVNEYIEEGFMQELVETVFRKKSQMILKAESKSELQKILQPSHPCYIAGKAVPEESPYYVEEEELILWSGASLRTPLNDVGYKRYMELFQKLIPEKSKVLETEAD